MSTQLQRQAMSKGHDSYNTNNKNSHRWGSSGRSTPSRGGKFQEIEGAAFFIGKLNKNHDRTTIYNNLRDLTKSLNFYIRKLDMPYANNQTQRGNKGYAFVHTNSKEEAARIVKMGNIHLGKQVCEVKAYGGRSNTTSSAQTSGYHTPVETQRVSHNPLKSTNNNNAWAKSSIVNILQSNKNEGEDEEPQPTVNIIPDHVYESKQQQPDNEVSSTHSDLGTGSFDTEDSETNEPPQVATTGISFDKAEMVVLEESERSVVDEATFALYYQGWYEYFLDTLQNLPSEQVQQMGSTLDQLPVNAQ